MQPDSTLDYRGARLKGSGKADAITYPVEVNENTAVIVLS